MSDIAIKVENLSKYYNLGVINTGTLGKDLQSWLWKKIGKEDPNKRIGAHEDNVDGFWALKDLNFEIKKGDRVGIIGKNGAGKSTLLKMLSQISAPTEGRIYINGKVASLLEVGTGFNPELTGRENIYMNGAILGMKKREIDAKIDEIIAFSEITRHIDTPVKRYSSGMYVRLAFAVAAHLDSDILIADEVLAVGDANFQKKAIGKMNELSGGQGRTVLFVSHNMGAVKQLCNKGIVLEKGEIKFKGDINKAISNYISFGIPSKFVPFSIDQLEIYIKNISFRDIVCSWDEFEIEIDVISKKNYHNVGLYIMISNSELKRIFTTSTANTENMPPIIREGTNNFVCKIHNLALCAGQYYIGFGMDEPSVKWWYVNEYMFSFDIIEGYKEGRKLSNHENYGICYLDTSWTCK